MADQNDEEAPAPPPASLCAPRADGLERFYDVCIVGTGLVEAMLSAALAKVGKSILHLEKRDYYGGEDCASFHFKDLKAWAQAHQHQARPPPPREQDEQQQHSNDAPSAPASTTPAALRVQWPRARWRNAAGKGATTDDKEKEDRAMQWDPTCPKEVTLQPLLPASHSTVRVLRVEAAPPQPPPPSNDASADVDSTKKTAAAAAAAEEKEKEKEEGGLEGQQPPPWTAERLGASSRDFNLDLCPLVLLAGSDAIGPLLSSGVASYLEFRTLQALFIATTSSSSGSSSTSGGGASEAPVAFHRVPCSKTDVFASTLLPAKEKRQLMRFLQCAADWGFARQSGEEAVTRRNEAELGQGRSLHRPQNKAVGDLDVQAFAGRPFLAFLRDGAKMDAHLQGVILHALALAPSSSTASSSSSPALTTEAGLARVCAHLRGLGQYGRTAFLWPIFGAADVTQAFCRTASVWGATFLLRAQPRGLWVTPDGRRCLGLRLPDDDDGDGEGHAIACDHLILGQAALPGCMPTGQRALRRLAILDGPPPALLRAFQATTAAAAAGEGGGAGGLLSGGVIPAGVLPGGGGGATVHFYCVDPTARCSPVGVYLLHLAATLKCNEGKENEDDARALALMDAATAALLEPKQQPGQPGKGERGVSVLWSVTYEDPILRPPPPPSSLPSNVLFVRKAAPEFYLQAALDQAQELFAALCPGEPFLPAEVPEGVLPFDFLRGSGGEGDRDQEEEILEATVSVFHQQQQQQQQQQQPPPAAAGEAGGGDGRGTP